MSCFSLLRSGRALRFSVLSSLALAFAFAGCGNDSGGLLSASGGSAGGATGGASVASGGQADGGKSGSGSTSGVGGEVAASGGSASGGGNMGGMGGTPVVPTCPRSSVDTIARFPTWGLIADFNADLGVSDSAGLVQSWKDQSKVGALLSLTTGSAPYNSDALNGHSSISLGGAKLVADQTSVYQQLINGQGFTWMAVVKAAKQNHAVKNNFFGTLTGSSPWSGLTGGMAIDDGDANNSVPYAMVRPTLSDNFASDSGSYAPETWLIVAGRFEEGIGTKLLEFFVNSRVPSGSVVASVGNSATSGPLTIGAEQENGGEYFDGELARLVIYRRPLSTGELAGLGCQFELDYGISTEY